MKNKKNGDFVSGMHDYGYNRASLRTWRKNIITANRDELYAYDGLYQIKDWKQGTLNADNTAIIGTPARTGNWNYDSAGNWNVYNQSSLPTQTRTHNQSNEILTVNGAPNVTQYDAAGNMTLSNGNTMIWDAWNRLVQIQGSGINAIYQYDGLHRRISQNIISGEVSSLDFYYNSNWKIIEERFLGSNSINNQYIYGERGRNDLIFSDTFRSVITSRYALSDAALSVTGVADATGAILRRYSYTAFGDTILDYSSSPNFDWLVRFHGEFYELYTQLYDYGYRYYSPALGRWLSRDPIEEKGGLNLYQFIRNDGINLSDYLGAMDITRCDNLTSNLYNIVLNNPKKFPGLAKIWWTVLRLGCIHNISCVCCSDSSSPCSKDAGGCQTPNGSVYICADNIAEENVAAILAHELIHVLQTCPGEISTCEESICAEVQAYLHSGQCAGRGDAEQIKNCVIGGVMYSSKKFCPSLTEQELKELIKDKYGSCVNSDKNHLILIDPGE